VGKKVKISQRSKGKGQKRIEFIKFIKFIKLKATEDRFQ